MDGLTPDTAVFAPLLNPRPTLVAVYETRAAWQQAQQQECETQRALFEASFRDEGEETKAHLRGLRERAALARERADELAEETLRQLQLLATSFPRAARDLADLLWDLLSESESRGEEDRAAHYVALLERHDDGRYVDLVDGTATLEVRSDPAGAHVRLSRLDRDDPSPRELGPTPVDPFDLEPGDYLLEFEAPGLVGARREIRIGRAADVQVLMRLFTLSQVGVDSFYLPAGRFCMGGERGVKSADAADQLFVDNIAVARRPVTVGEFLLFLDELAQKDPERALRHTPATMRADLHHQASVMDVSYRAAADYASWLRERTGTAYRLPTEAEWEKAALAPAGEGGLHGRCEWTAPLEDRGRPLLRGGARVCCRRHRDAHAIPEGVAFRLVHDLAPGGGERVLEMQIPDTLDDRVAA